MFKVMIATFPFVDSVMGSFDTTMVSDDKNEASKTILSFQTRQQVPHGMAVGMFFK